MPAKEVTVCSNVSMPRGYGFLPKGIQYKTLHCRKLTREAGKTLYVVVDAKKRHLGLRAPKLILQKVHEQARKTLEARRSAVQQRDLSFVEAAAKELDVQFPKLPDKEKTFVLKHSFKKYSGRVGRTGVIPLPRKALLAAIAHVRHRHTEYDALLARGIERAVARTAVNSKIENILRDWGYAEGK